MRNVLFIACIELGNKALPDGVNVKNKHILRYLKNLTNVQVKLIDTYNWRQRVLPLFFQIAFLSLISEKIVISINTISAYWVIRFLYFLGLDKKLIYLVVGGDFNTLEDKGMLNLKYFKRVFKIYVQTKEMETTGRRKGLNNIEQLPNSKYFKDIDVDYKRAIKLPIKCFYLGRIHPEKGIDIMIKALTEVNRSELKYTIDFYGPIKSDYEKLFIENVSKSYFANYKGVIDLINNAENYYQLSQYDLFIFPTFWGGEGFPGVVIDSFISGVPILASDWNHNSEIIEDGYNGFIFKSKDEDDLIDKLNYIYENNSILLKMRQNAHATSQKYKTENVLKVLKNII